MRVEIRYSWLTLCFALANAEFNATRILDRLLGDYDSYMRPNTNMSRPTLIYVDIFVRSMSKISEVESEFSFDCYFRQTWTDMRLAFGKKYKSGPDMVVVNVKMLPKLWQPYTYFLNSNTAYVRHCIFFTISIGLTLPL